VWYAAGVREEALQQEDLGQELPIFDANRTDGVGLVHHHSCQELEARVDGERCIASRSTRCQLLRAQGSKHRPHREVRWFAPLARGRLAAAAGCSGHAQRASQQREPTQQLSAQPNCEPTQRASQLGAPYGETWTPTREPRVCTTRAGVHTRHLLESTHTHTHTHTHTQTHTHTHTHTEASGVAALSMYGSACVRRRHPSSQRLHMGRRFEIP
jgi:ketosteroid isomerase-like protein